MLTRADRRGGATAPLMLDGALGGTVGFLALLGGVALMVRAVRSLGTVILRAAEIASATGMAEASARRGDLTALGEAREIARDARSRRRRNAAITCVWISWLIIPLILGWVPEAWALAAPLWLLPYSGSRAPRTG